MRLALLIHTVDSAVGYLVPTEAWACSMANKDVVLWVHQTPDLHAAIPAGATVGHRMG